MADTNTDPTVKYFQKWTALDAQYSTIKPLYQDISEFILPRGQFTDNEQPFEGNDPKTLAPIINQTATTSVGVLGAGMMTGLASQSRPWFRFGLQNQELMEVPAVKEWLSRAEDITRAIFSQSNFYTTGHAGFEDQGGFGSTCIFMEKDFNKVVHFTRFPVGSYRLAVGTDGIPDTLYRKVWMSAKAMEAKFGKDELSNDAKSALDTDPFKTFLVLHVVEPRENRDVLKEDSLNMPYKDVWIQEGEKSIMLEQGYEEKPFVAPRWYSSGVYPYGVGPGMDALGQVMMLQEMEASGIKGLHREVDPPLNVPAEMKDVASLMPGANNYFKGQDKIEAILNVSLNLEHLEFKIDRIENKIGKIFLVDVFLIITSADQGKRDITATEIMQRKEEKLTLLGPVVEKQINEFLDPVIDRVFGVALRRGLYGDLPEELQVESQELKIEYISVLAQAQKLVDAQGMQFYLGEQERVIAVTQDPGTLANTDFDEYLRKIADITSIPPGISRGKLEVEDIREAEAAAAAAAQQQEQMAQAAATMNTLGGASTEPGTALGDLKEAVVG